MILMQGHILLGLILIYMAHQISLCCYYFGTGNHGPNLVFRKCM
uniref:Uncharacterized protein n=1 Tax=Arundo donax TaxID=35708 RepID=A0A0A9AXB8_ARUDO